MSAPQSGLAPANAHVPVRRFERYEAAVEAIAGYEKLLCENASRRRADGLTVTDQDQQDVAFCLFPDHPCRPPLAILGGMGPLAGAMAFRRACARFGNSRAVALYQACSMPDRSTVILAEGVRDTPVCRQMARRLADAVRRAAGFASQTGRRARCIIACNSAHYFWHLFEDGLHEIEMVSLVDSSVQALKSQSCGKALLLGTEGARAGQVFSAPLRHAGVAFDEPSPVLERLLMRAVFEGVKALDDHRAVELGNKFFETVLANGQNYDCLLAGCTELPLTIDLLKLHGSRPVAAFLSRVKIVDPLEEALCRA